MSRKYSRYELEAIAEIAAVHGDLKYDNSFDLAGEFFKKTGVYRCTGALYMAYWRMKKGLYGAIL